MVPDKADLVLHEGVILGHPASDSVAITDGRITAVASFNELKPLVGPRTHMVRLAGRAVAPGLIDSHLHFQEAASAAVGLQVSRAHTIADLQTDLRTGAARTAPGNWLKAFGCDEALLKERRGPTRKELDDAVSKHPLRLRHQTLHASWLNSRAIRALGLEAADFKPPDGARLIPDSAGRITGLVVGMEEWITRRLPPVTAADIEARARIFSRELAAAGTTAFTDATVRNGLDEVRLFARLRSDHSFCQRAFLMLGAAHLDEVHEARAAAEAAGMSLTAVKFIPGASTDPASMAEQVVSAIGAGLDCAFHATEIEELEAALSAVELARQLQPECGTTRWRIEHGGLIPSDYVTRLQAIGAWVVTNPGFVHFRGDKYRAEPGLVPYLYRVRSLKLAGIEIAGATDAPVTPARPLAAIAAAVSRTTANGDQLAPDETVNLDEALALFTRSAAKLARLEAGEIALGRLADLIVLPSNPFDMTPAELVNLPVDMTIIDGHIVYERGVSALATGIPAS